MVGAVQHGELGGMDTCAGMWDHGKWKYIPGRTGLSPVIVLTS